MPTRVFIADDHLIMRQGLAYVLSQKPQYEMVGDAADGASAWAAISQLRPEVVLTDLDMPGEGGLALTRRIHATFPEIKVVVLTGSQESALAKEALQAGASGFVQKTNGQAELLAAVEAVLTGRIYLCADTTTAMLRAQGTSAGLGNDNKPVLSERELQVLRLVVAGRRNKEIADELKIGIKSVETYRSRLMNKLDCATPAELVRHAIRTGVVKA
ncbi:MAG: response regulator transcription factor [Opitutaceae bacterium]